MFHSDSQAVFVFVLRTCADEFSQFKTCLCVYVCLLIKVLRMGVCARVCACVYVCL
jgi:hypothetical protein